MTGFQRQWVSDSTFGATSAYIWLEINFKPPYFSQTLLSRLGATRIVFLGVDLWGNGVKQPPHSTPPPKSYVKFLDEKHPVFEWQMSISLVTPKKKTFYFVPCCCSYLVLLCMSKTLSFKKHKMKMYIWMQLKRLTIQRYTLCEIIFEIHTKDHKPVFYSIDPHWNKDGLVFAFWPLVEDMAQSMITWLLLFWFTNSNQTMANPKNLYVTSSWMQWSISEKINGIQITIVWSWKMMRWLMALLRTMNLIGFLCSSSGTKFGRKEAESGHRDGSGFCVDNCYNNLSIFGFQSQDEIISHPKVHANHPTNPLYPRYQPWDWRLVHSYQT